MYTPAEVLYLAEELAIAEGVAVSSISKRIFGNKSFTARLERGYDMNSRNLNKMARWLTENWPEDVPWPLAVKEEVPEWSSVRLAEPCSTSP
jgi:hypothetical protein